MTLVKQADRLIARSVIGSLLIVWLVLVGFDVLDQLVRQLGYVGQHQYTVTDAFIYIALTLPRRMYQHFGSAALVGGLLALGGLAASGELTALRAAGMSKLRIAASAMGAVAVLTLLVMAMGEIIAPTGDQQAHALQLRMRFGSVALAHGGGLWARDGNSFINARSAVASTKPGRNTVRLLDVRVYTLSADGQLQRFIHAHDAEQRGPGWTLDDVSTYRLDGASITNAHQAHMPWHTRLDSTVLRQSVIPADYLSMRDQRRNIRYLRSNGLNPAVYANAFWAHAIYPLNVLALVLCTMPFAFGTLRSGGLGRRIFVGMLLAIAWYFLQRVITGTAVVYGISPVLANLGPALILLAIGAVYFWRYG